MISRSFVVMTSALMAVSLACGGGPQKRGTSGRQSPPYAKYPAAAEAPAPPPRQAVALDRGLSATARGEVAQALRSSEPLLRGQAVDALRYLPQAEASKHLLPLLDDAYRGVRFSAAMLAGERKLTDLYGPLRRLARTDPDPNVAVATRFALHKLGDRRLTHDFEQLAVSQDPRVRRNVALALGLLGERSALKILRTMRIDDDALVRQQALEAMWRLGEQDALEGL